MEKSWFFNNGQKYGQEELRKYFTRIYRNGISLDDAGLMEMQVSASGSQVTVAPGFAIIGGFAYESDLPIQMTITPDSNFERIDRMVLKMDIAAMEITVAPGFAIIGGFAYESDLPIQMTITPDSNFERIDRMVLKMDIAAMEIRLYRKPGIAASSPQPPQLQRDGIVHELSLAQVKVSASGKLTVVDERADQKLCGSIRPRNLTELETMMKE